MALKAGCYRIMASFKKLALIRSSRNALSNALLAKEIGAVVLLAKGPSSMPNLPRDGVKQPVSL